jgi:membrane protease YdiL (CAAX protease family)
VTDLPDSVVLDSLDPQQPPVLIKPAPHEPRTLGFWRTFWWGLLIIVAFFIGQLLPIGYFLLTSPGPFDSVDALQQALIKVASPPSTVALSAIMGLPGLLIPIYFAVRYTRLSFTEYLGLRWTGWKNLAFGVIGMIVILGIWEVISEMTGHEEANSSFMIDMLKTAEGDGTVWLLVIAFCVAAPISEELLARGFLYRGWSDSFLRVPGAIILSSMVWTALHLQYDWFGLLNVLSLGLWFGYLRSRTHSTYLTMVLHGLNNLAATVQTMWLVGHG